ncbi:MAG TPA: alpha/beta hydrolase, partial [Gammaproteobacteria bacterium]|nr:alpha/beta hydrolase [Gammaproteobacteria bacterium]
WRQGFPVIEIPTLMLWGEKDIALSMRSTLGTKEYVSNLTLRYFKGISHHVQQDAPEEVNQMIEAFLNDQDVPEYLNIKND